VPWQIKTIRAEDASAACGSALQVATTNLCGSVNRDPFFFASMLATWPSEWPSRRPHSVVRGSLISWTLIESLRSAIYVADEGRLRCMRSAVLLCILFLQEKHKLLRPWRRMQQLGRFRDGTFPRQLGSGAVSLHATHCSISTCRCSGFRGPLIAKSVFQFLAEAS
jgi:hypothetical protein